MTESKGKALRVDNLARTLHHWYLEATANLKPEGPSSVYSTHSLQEEQPTVSGTEAIKATIGGAISQTEWCLLEAKSIIQGWAEDENDRCHIHKDTILKAVNAALTKNRAELAAFMADLQAEKQKACDFEIGYGELKAQLAAKNKALQEIVELDNKSQCAQKAIVAIAAAALAEAERGG